MSSPTDAAGRERWARLEATFDAALDLGAAERADYLDAACGDDPSLRREIESLIVASETGGRRVERLIRDAAGKALASGAGAGGNLIGPYRVVDTIGHGGMGAVYLARREDREFEQKVAIKLLHKTLATPELLARFRSERQILADLNHPNIAHLIDGGSTADGIPYLVMEYVEGEPIDVYCDHNELTVRERLDVFRQVCSAIEVAHQNLIVHRDIKPGNILVTRDGTPKLLDFGIAKILSPHPKRGVTDLTQLGDRLLTPDHASPEQVLGKTVTTASDIYALGVLLYELLCGHRPFWVSSLTPAQMQKVICDTEPEPPSRAIGSRPTVEGKRIAEDPRPIALSRRATPERLRRQLRGDLDNIVLCALRKEPERRYSSVGLLSDDLRRHLRGLPVTAQRDTWTYRAGKFVGRNRIGVSLGSLLVGIVIGFAIVTTIQSRRVAHHADIAVKAIHYLTDTIIYADPLVNQGEDMTVRELFDEVAARADQELADEPEIRIVLQETIGRVYHGMSRHDEALDILRRSYQSHQVLVGDGHPDLVPVMNLIGVVLRETGAWDEAEDVHRRALVIALKHHDATHSDVAESQHNLAAALHAKENTLEAEVYYRKSLQTYTRLGTGYPKETADTLSDYARLLRRNGDFDGAESMLRQSLEINRRQLGPNHTYVAHDLENLGLTLQSRGDLAAAGPYFEESLEILQHVFKQADHQKISLAMSNVGRYLNAQGRHEEAEKMCRDALAMETRLSGADHQLTAFRAVGLARVLRARGQLAEAETLLQRSVAIFVDTLGEDHSFHSDALRNLGDLWREQGRAVEAVVALQRALAISRRTQPPGHWHIAACQSDLAAAQIALGRYDEARVLLGQAVEGLHATLGDRHRLTKLAIARQGEIL